MPFADQFAGLPLGQLIAQPFIEVAKGQANGKTNVLKFTLNRQIVNAEGNSTLQPIEIQAPLLSLIPVPAFLMDEATVNFEMERKEQTMTKSTGDQSVESEFKTSFWGCHASIQGKVAAHQENSRQSDSSAKYKIFARATQWQIKKLRFCWCITNKTVAFNLVGVR